MKVSASIATEEYRLKNAILIYGLNGHGSELSSIATLHKIEDATGRPVLGAGRPMNETDYSELLNQLAPAERPKMEWLDHSILARGMGRMVWWTPAMKRPMFFQKSSMGSETFDGQGLCPLPPMIWQATENKLFVYAFDGAGAPDKTTKLKQAPLFNVWARGEVCVGTARRPSAEMRGDPKAWEHFLFGSHFTHPNFTQKDRLIKGFVPGVFWQSMVSEPAESFPMEVLVDIDRTVEDLIASDFETRFAILKATAEF